MNSYNITAVVSPDEENVRKRAKALGEKTNYLAKLYSDKDLLKVVVDELARFGAANGLIPVEVPVRVRLIPEKWTSKNSLVSEPLKVRRRQIYTFYKDSIDV